MLYYYRNSISKIIWNKPYDSEKLGGKKRWRWTLSNIELSMQSFCNYLNICWSNVSNVFYEDLYMKEKVYINTPVNYWKSK